jgi:phage terminase Nu1 subunit (DNA packaging protein)
MSDKGAVFSAEVVGKLLNLSEKRIKQLTYEGVIHEFAPKHYKLAPTIQAYVRYLQDKLADGDQTSDYNTEKARLIKAKRENEELELALKRSELHKVADVEYVVTNMILAFKSKLVSLPQNVLPSLINNSNDKNKMLEILTNAITEALNELSEYDIESFDDDG